MTSTLISGESDNQSTNLSTGLYRRDVEVLNAIALSALMVLIQPQITQFAAG